LLLRKSRACQKKTQDKEQTLHENLPSEQFANAIRAASAKALFWWHDGYTDPLGLSSIGAGRMAAADFPDLVRSCSLQVKVLLECFRHFRDTPHFDKIVRTQLKTRDLIFALTKKSERREMRAEKNL
jgi:hypothetical protein